MDNKLLELCKQVYVIFPEWGIDTAPERLYHFDRDGDIVMAHPMDAISFNPKTCVPLYTSDYLLEKIPPVILDKVFRHLQINYNGDRTFHLCYVEPYDKEFRGSHIINADSLLVALLKLTLLLHESGELV